MLPIKLAEESLPAMINCITVATASLRRIFLSRTASITPAR